MFFGDRKRAVALQLPQPKGCGLRPFSVLLNPEKNEIILDAGCGNGRLSMLIAKKAGKVYAVDISKSAFSKAKKIAPKNIIFQKGNVEKLNFKKEFFDKILSVETLEHVLHPNKMLKSFQESLKEVESL